MAPWFLKRAIRDGGIKGLVDRYADSERLLGEQALSMLEGAVLTPVRYLEGIRRCGTRAM